MNQQLAADILEESELISTDGEKTQVIVGAQQYDEFFSDPDLDYSALKKISEEEFSLAAGRAKYPEALGIGYVIRLHGTMEDYVDMLVSQKDHVKLAELAFATLSLFPELDGLRLRAIMCHSQEGVYSIVNQWQKEIIRRKNEATAGRDNAESRSL